MKKPLPILNTLMPDSKLDCYTTIFVLINNLKAEYRNNLLEFISSKNIGKGEINTLINNDRIYQVTYTAAFGTESTQKSRLFDIRDQMYRAISEWINLQPNYMALINS